MQFQDLPIQPSTLLALEAMGFEQATPVQAQAIPFLLEGRDVIGQAQTGTGKTAAFGIPLVEAAHNKRRGLVLVPTRELATQVQRELQAIGKGSPLDVVCLIGGAPFQDQARALQRHPGASIVATPGRVLDHLQRGTLDLGDISLFILDEADEMLSMGFQDELEAIVSHLPAERQNILFTATLSPTVERLAKKTLTNPETVRTGHGPATGLRQCYAVVPGRERSRAVARILEAEDPQAALLFARTRARVDELVEDLRANQAEALHGGMAQPARDAVMRRFRDGTTRLLIATDVAARGLDIEEVGLVIHDEPPTDVDTYVHRIGRTARAGRSGMSIVFVTPGKTRRLGGLRSAGELEHYEVPDQAGLARIRMRRIVAALQATAPGDIAADALKQATEAGLTVEEVALRALEHLLDAEQEEEQPQAATSGPGRLSALALKVGKIDDIHPGSIVGVLINAGGLRPEDIGRIDILPRMSVVEVPSSEVDRLCESLERVQLSRQWLRPRPAEDWRFRTPAR